jgi:bacterioferritin
MKGPDVSLKHLQRALIMDLATINTYLYQERQLDDWGLDRLAGHMGAVK